MVAAQILKHKDRVQSGTESHIVRSRWRRHRSSNPGIECIVAQNYILSDPDGGGTDPHISPRISSKCWAALNCVLKIGPLLCRTPGHGGAGTLFSYSLYISTYIYTIPCDLLLHVAMHFLYKLRRCHALLSLFSK